MLSILWTQIVKNKPDQIHLHSRFSIPNFFALILAKFRGIPVVHYEHLASFVSGENIFTYLCWIYDQFVSRITYFLSDQIIVVSPSCKTFIVQNLGANPNKITVNQHASKFTDPGRTYADKFTIVENWNIFFAARLVPLKNPILTLEAIKILSQKSTQKFHFNMAGDGKLRSQVEKYIEREKLQSFVSYVGYLNHEQMSSQLNSSHIFLNCSRLEGFPNTVLEAITKTNICLVSDVGGNNDLIKDQRLLIPLEKLSPESLAEKIQFIFDRYRSILPELQHEKDYVLQHYTWESAVARLEQVIHQV